VRQEKELLMKNEFAMLTLGDLRKILRLGPDDAVVPVEVDFDGRRVCLYGIISEILALQTINLVEDGVIMEDDRP
jgi:hypothetical protein